MRSNSIFSKITFLISTRFFYEIGEKCIGGGVIRTDKKSKNKGEKNIQQKTT